MVMQIRKYYLENDKSTDENSKKMNKKLLRNPIFKGIKNLETQRATEFSVTLTHTHSVKGIQPCVFLSSRSEEEPMEEEEPL